MSVITLCKVKKEKFKNKPAMFWVIYQKLYHEGGFDLADTVKAQVLLSDLNDFY